MTVSKALLLLTSLSFFSHLAGASSQTDHEEDARDLAQTLPVSALLCEDFAGKVEVQSAFVHQFAGRFDEGCRIGRRI
jgi:hypothetical protein